MKKSELYPQLPEVSFAVTDPDTIRTQIISTYESASGRTLAMSDPVRLFLYAVADIIIHQRNLIDIAAKNNLIAYAEGDYLDHIGALFAVSRMTGEDDDSLRERIRLAPDSFSSAGPAKAYEFYAKTADPNIIDVKILTPPDTDPGHVDIYPLMKGGLPPDSHVLDAVFMACSGDDVRPDTDFVTVKPPVVVGYNLSMTYWIDVKDSAMSANIRKAVNDAVDSWLVWQKSALGRDINPSELIHRAVAAGAKRCEVIEPGFTVLAPYEAARAENISLVFGGLEDG